MVVTAPIRRLYDTQKRTGLRENFEVIAGLALIELKRSENPERG